MRKTGATLSLLNDSLKNTEITPSRQSLTVHKKLHYKKTSLGDNDEFLKSTKLLPKRPQTSSEDENKKYIIDKLVRHIKTPEKTLYHVRWYGYDSAYDT